MCPTRRTARCAAAAELLGRVRAELPAVGELGERDQVLVSAWLTRLRSARTRRAYAGDVAAWLGWLTDRETGALAAGRVHVDLWAATSWMTGRRPPACAAACRRCRRSTGTARPMTWLAGCPPRAWRGRRWIRTTPPRWAGPGPRLGPGRRGRRRQRSRGAAHRGGGAAAAAQRPARRRGLRRRHRRPGRGLQPPGAARGLIRAGGRRRSRSPRVHHRGKAPQRLAGGQDGPVAAGPLQDCAGQPAGKGSPPRGRRRPVYRLLQPGPGRTRRRGPRKADRPARRSHRRLGRTEQDRACPDRGDPGRQARPEAVPAHHPAGLLRVDKAKAKTEANLDGKYLLRSCDPDLSAEDIALGYKQLLEVERAGAT